MAMRSQCGIFSEVWPDPARVCEDHSGRMWRTEGRADEKEVQAQGRCNDQTGSKNKPKAMAVAIVPKDLHWPSHLHNTTFNNYLLFSLLSWRLTCIESRRDARCMGLNSWRPDLKQKRMSKHRPLIYLVFHAPELPWLSTVMIALEHSLPLKLKTVTSWHLPLSENTRDLGLRLCPGGFWRPKTSIKKHCRCWVRGRPSFSSGGTSHLPTAVLYCKTESNCQVFLLSFFP